MASKISTRNVPGSTYAILTATTTTTTLCILAFIATTTSAHILPQNQSQTQSATIRPQDNDQAVIIATADNGSPLYATHALYFDHETHSLQLKNLPHKNLISPQLSTHYQQLQIQSQNVSDSALRMFVFDFGRKVSRKERIQMEQITGWTFGDAISSTAYRLCQSQAHMEQGLQILARVSSSSSSQSITLSSSTNNIAFGPLLSTHKLSSEYAETPRYRYRLRDHTERTISQNQHKPYIPSVEQISTDLIEDHHILVLLNSIYVENAPISENILSQIQNVALSLLDTSTNEQLVSVTALSSRSIDVNLLCSFVTAQSIAHSVAELHDVAWVNERTKVQLLNAYATVVGQQGLGQTSPEAFINNSAQVDKGPFQNGNALLWKKGLIGTGQVVAVGDTGINYDNCYFRGEADDIKVLLDQDGCTNNHTKIKCLFKNLDQIELNDTQGHGSHVAGTAVGLHFKTSQGRTPTYADLVNTNTFSNGMAPGAKLASTDIVSNRGFFYVSDDLASDNLFKRPYELAGARIFTNSWGCSSPLVRPCNVYNFLTRTTDEWIFNNPDSLILFAAGNDGGTVFNQDAQGGIININSDLSRISTGNNLVDDAGMIDLDISTHQSESFIRFRDGFYTIGAPAGAKNIVAVGASENDNSGDMQCFGKKCSQQNVAYFSSRGPTMDGREKPDVIFPGMPIKSVDSSYAAPKSSQQCLDEEDSDGTRYSMGTSMSTPGVAGLAALVREYLLKYNPATGALLAHNSSAATASGALDHHGPSGTLIKAMLLASARTLTGVYYNSSLLSNFGLAPPQMIDLPTLDKKTQRYAYGYGMVQLGFLLKFKDEDPLKTLFLDDRHEIDNGEVHYFEIKVTKRTKIAITFTYADYPGPVRSSYSQDPVLVNNLDLKIVASTASGCDVQTTGEWSNSTLDNVERLPSAGYYHCEGDGKLTVEIHGVNVPMGPQPYSIVMHGYDFSIMDKTESNYVPKWSEKAVIPRTQVVLVPATGDFGITPPPNPPTPVPENPSNGANDTNSGKNNTGEIVGIVVAAILGVALAVVLVVFAVLVHRHNKQRAQAQTENDNYSGNGSENPV